MTSAVLKDISVYIMVSALMFVMCVIWHLVIRSILKNINLYIALSTLVFEMFAIMHTVVTEI